MRVAYICADHGVPVFGRKGCSIHVQEVIRALIALGAKVEVFASRIGGKPPKGLETVTIHVLPESSAGPRAVREQKALNANGYLRYALNCSRPFDLIYERYSLWSFAGMEYAWSTGIPGVLEVNAPLIEEQAKYRGLLDRKSAEDVAQRVFGYAKVLVAVSNEVAEYLRSYPISRERIQRITNGVNPDRFPADLMPSRPGNPGTFTVGFVGTLKAWHGLKHLAEAFAMLHRRVPGARLLIVGDGPEKENLLNDLSANNLDSFAHLTGSVTSEEVPGLLASMDVAVAPYPQLKNFYFSPLKVYEYMAAGLPVVASRIGQLTELVQDGENGLLCSPGNSEALADALYRLSCDSGLCRRLGRAARTTVLRDYAWEKIVMRILRLAGKESLSKYDYNTHITIGN